MQSWLVFIISLTPLCIHCRQIKDTAQSIEEHLEKRRTFIYFLLRCLSLVDMVILVHLIFSNAELSLV